MHRPISIFKGTVLAVLFLLIYITISALYIHEDKKHTGRVNLSAEANSSNVTQVQPSNGHGHSTIAVVLVMCATRPLAIENHLRQLVGIRPNSDAFPIIVSQDGDSSTVKEVIETFMNKHKKVAHIQHEYPTGKPYEKIAAHYKWALDKVFSDKNVQYVIVTEDDLSISRDFFSYFTATRQLLEEDESIWCISAYNDNGNQRASFANHTKELWRTDFFPGLGWMLSRKIWMELSPGWPSIYWDDWMRKPEIRKNRVCIRPEVSRTKHDMSVAGRGSSNKQYNSYLETINLSGEAVDFEKLDISYLKKDRYDASLRETVNKAVNVNASYLERERLDPNVVYKVLYGNGREFHEVAENSELMTDMRNGIARTAYKGVVAFKKKRSRVLLVSKLYDFNSEHTQQQSPYVADWEYHIYYLEFERKWCASGTTGGNQYGKFEGVCDPYSDEFKKWSRFKTIRHWYSRKMITI